MFGMMKHHKLIWTTTGIVVVLTAVVLMARHADDPARELSRTPYLDLTEGQTQVLIDTMLACLDRDPQARRVRTRAIVETVAALADNGILETAETHYALGLRRYGQGLPEDHPVYAEESLRRAIALRPDWALAHNTLGVVLTALRRYDAAEEALRRAIELEPDRSRPYNDLAVLLRHVAGLPDEEKARLGILSRHGDLLEEAERAALVALELDPNDVANHNNYGNLLLARGRIEEAEQQYRIAIRLEPDQPAPYYNLACLAARQGDLEQVVAHLNCAIILSEVFREEARLDKEFDAFREDPGFHRLVYGR